MSILEIKKDLGNIKKNSVSVEDKELKSRAVEALAGIEKTRKAIFGK